MNNKHNAGFSLIEVLVAIVILAAIVVPTCSSLVLSHRMNAKTEELMQAQLDVSSAVETLMAEGIKAEKNTEEKYIPKEGYNRFADVTVVINVTETSNLYYEVTVTSCIDPSVTVTTYIKIVDVSV